MSNVIAFRSRQDRIEYPYTVAVDVRRTGPFFIEWLHDMLGPEDWDYYRAAPCDEQGRGILHVHSESEVVLLKMGWGDMIEVIRQPAQAA